MSRPTLADAVAALRTTYPPCPWIGPTQEEAEMADLLEELESLHEPGDDGCGWCLGCKESWPCTAWVYAEQLAVQYLGRAADRVYARNNKPTTPDQQRRGAA